VNRRRDDRGGKQEETDHEHDGHDEGELGADRVL